MSLVAFLQKIMAMKIFNPIFPCQFMKRLMKQKPLKFITESPKLDVLKTNTKVSVAKKTVKETYRSKDVLKLKQIDKKFKLVEPGFKVLDIGAAPGSWSQYLANKTNANGKGKEQPVGMVVAVDLQSFDKIEGVHCLPKMDFLKELSQKKIADVLGRDKKFDFIFSDMSRPSSGVPYFDEDRMTKSVLCVYLFMVKHLKKGGGCLVRLQGCEGNQNIQQEAKKLFRLVSYHAPVISSASLPDLYLLGRDFMGVKA